MAHSGGGTVTVPASASTPGIVALDGVIDPASLYRQALQLRWEPQLPVRVRPNAAAAVGFLLQSRLRELESAHPPPAAVVQGDGRVQVVLPLADQIVSLRRAAAALHRNINSLDAWDVLSELDIPGNHASEEVMREALTQSAGPATGAGAADAALRTPPTCMQVAADEDPDQESRHSAATIATVQAIRSAFGHGTMETRASDAP